MDPYLPGEIPVMVLRWLAANQCDQTAMKLIDEMPGLSDYIPKKPPSLSDKNYLKHLLRSSSNLGLKDVLWDYGNTKILVEEILDDEDSMVCPSGTEPLLNKIKIVQERLKTATQVHSNVDLSQMSNTSKVPVISKRDSSANTEKDFECFKCLTRKFEVKSKADSGCQTDELTAVQFGLRDKFPVIFYQKLMNDDQLQQKIAQTINEHMEDPEGERSERFSKISSKAETEIDKFLVELLQDMPSDSNMPSDTTLLQSLGGSSSVADIERNLTSMFDDADDEAVSSDPNVDPHPSAMEQESLFSPTEVIIPSTSSGGVTNTRPNTSPTASCSKPEALDATSESSSDSTKILDLIGPPGSTTTPKRSQRFQAVKRITPTPLSNANVNPVFNTSVVVEKKKIEVGDKTANMSVITTNVQTPSWQQLKRRAIAPKVPRSPKITNNVTIVNTQNNGSDKAFKFGVDANLIKKVARSPISSPGSKLSRSSSNQDNNNSYPPSAHKRKATPVKLTPEKAKDDKYNFMLFYNDTNTSKPASAIKPSESANTATHDEHGVNGVDSTVKRTPLPCSFSTISSNGIPPGSNKGKVIVSENSQQEVTPMQPPPTIDSFSTSTLKTISPNALERLIASANKAGASLPVVSGHFANKRKSFSTPRKRKHVRNLSFATPPSLKAITPGSEPSRGELATSLKRKANDDLFSAELRSKKRLNWPESVEKGKGGASAGFIVQRRSSDSLVTSSTTEIGSKDQSNQETRHMSSSSGKSAPEVPVKSSMPTILEESMSNVSMSNDAPQQLIPGPSSTSAPGFNPPQMTLKPTSNLSNQLTILTIPVPLADGTVQKQYFQLADDMQTLIPLSVVPPIEAPIGSQEPVQSNFTAIAAPIGQAAPIQQNKISRPPSQPNDSHTNFKSALSQIRHESSPQPTPPAAVHSTSDLLRNPAKWTSQSTSSSAQQNPNSQQNSNRVAASGPNPPVPPVLVSPNTSVATVEPMNTEKDNTGFHRNRSGSSLKTQDRAGPSISRDSALARKASNKKNETSDAKPKSPPRRRRSSKQNEPQAAPVAETPKPTGQGESGHDKPKRTSRSKTNEKILPTEKESAPKDTGRRRNDKEVTSKSKSLTKDSQKAEYEGTKVQPEKDSRRGRGKGKQNEKPKKPAVTLNVKDLFGDSPVKMKKRPSNSKLHPDVIAAQTVASQAVPLGGPRISPRKPPLSTTESVVKAFQRVLPSVPDLLNEDATNKILPSIPSCLNEAVNDKTASCVPEPVSQAPAVPQPQMTSPEPVVQQQQQQQENVVFSIVPAPLGFPEPTPIKNFTETGHLNVSDITYNGSLITPFKTLPQQGLNETHFTLPPTPRVINDDNDSNSNSAQSFRYNTFDGLFHANLLTSTPLKPGIPRTPGRGSSSSNSQSPVQPGKISGVAPTAAQNQVLDQQQSKPPISVQTQTVIRPVPVSTGTTVAVAALPPAALDLSSSPSNANRSDGEIFSSDDEDTEKEKPQRKSTSRPHKQEPTTKNPTTGHRQPPVLQNRPQTSSSSTLSSPQQLRPLPRPPPLQPVPHISVSLNSNLKQTHGIKFHVGGREKFLTLSEKETLYSLISMSSGGKIHEDRKENPSRPPVVVKPPYPVAPAPQKPNDQALPTNAIGKQNTLDRLLKLVRNKKQTSKNS